MKRAVPAGMVGIAVALTIATPSLASTVSVSGANTVRFAETGNETNRVRVGYDAGTDLYSVIDTGAALTPSGTCIGLDAHTATCPGAGITRISVDAGNRDDSIVLEDQTIPSAATGSLDGGPGNDTVDGADGPGTVDGGSGNDLVSGRGSVSGGSGNDTVIGSPAADSIRGGNGRDAVDGGNGPDDIAGGRNADLLLYPAGRATPVNVTVGAGNNNDGGAEDEGGGKRDTVHGDIETVAGTASNDVLVGDGSSETLLGFAGADILIGTRGGDSLFGFEGDDLISGGDGRDTLRGSLGNDRLFGGPDSDRLAGGADDDFLRGKRGADVMKGKSGIDRINARDRLRDLKISCGPGSNRLEGAKRDRRRDPRPLSC